MVALEVLDQELSEVKEIAEEMQFGPEAVAQSIASENHQVPQLIQLIQARQEQQLEDQA